VLTRRGFLKFMFRCAAAGVALAGFSVVEAMATPRVTRYRLTPPNWTPGLKLKIAVLADFHASDPWMTAERIAAICGQANALAPDVILLLGDYVAAMRLIRRHVAPDAWAGALKGLRAPLGVHAVLGNHDYWDDADFQRGVESQTFAEKALRRAGIPLYINQSVRLEKNSMPFWLLGLGDQLAMGDHGIDDLAGTVRQIKDDAPAILMAHEPDIFPQVPSRVALTLSGHTHGGQVNLLGWTPVVPSRYGSRYVGGHIVEGGRHIIVSRGLGCSGLPLRFGSWPEILEIDLG